METSAWLTALRAFAARHDMEMEAGHHGGGLWNLTWAEGATWRKIQVWREDRGNFSELWITVLAWIDNVTGERAVDTHPRHYVVRLPVTERAVVETLEMARADAESLLADGH